MTGECPECGASIEADRFVVHELVPCPDCNADLELMELNPPVFHLAPKTETDWGE